MLLTYKGEKEMEITEILNISRATVFNVNKRNDREKKINWMFTRGKADERSNA